MKRRFFAYPDSALEFLSERHAGLGELIRRYGRLEREVTLSPFEGLTGSIISQQISGKAAESIGRKLEEKISSVTPENLLKHDIETLRSCGLSERKARYLHAIAEAAVRKEPDFETLSELSDEAVIERLTALHGVGRWTAEMLLIFSLERRDILSLGDFGIRKGIARLLGQGMVSKEEFEIIRERLSPWGSVASFYLWELAGEK